jgi:hypothetical protein
MGGGVSVGSRVGAWSVAPRLGQLGPSGKNLIDGGVAVPLRQTIRFTGWDFPGPAAAVHSRTDVRHRGQQLPYDPSGKIRTPQHVIADLSYNFLERKVLQRGHWLDAPRNDYGIDAILFHHNERGEAENGEVRFQLKATNSLRTSHDGKQISQRIETRHLRYWYFEPYPVFSRLRDRPKVSRRPSSADFFRRPKRQRSFSPAGVS